MTVWAAGFAASASLQVALWAVQLKTANAATVDLGWALSVALFGVLHATAGDGDVERRAWVAALVMAWSLRLSWHLLRDRAFAEREDGRYAAFRAKWGTFANPKFLSLYLFQTPLAALLSIPAVVVAADPRSAGWAGPLAALLAGAAIAGEAAADAQLAAFRADPANKGRTCRRGLWGLSRHPNYFFEWLFWFSPVVLAAGAPGWGWTLVGPAVMAVFLRWLTGVTLTEAHAAASRPDYAEYSRTTNMFVPWFPRA